MENLLDLVVVISSPTRWTTWRHLLGDFPGIDIISGPLAYVGRAHNLDAEVLPGMLAYERYHGEPAPGRSHVLSTRGEEGMPPWVVTLPTFRMERNEEGVVFVTWHPPHGPGDGQYLYRAFLEVLDAVSRFNGKCTGKIRRLGLPEDVLFDGYDPAFAADAVRRAYLEWAARSPE